jgi:hypothetical protein
MALNYDMGCVAGKPRERKKKAKKKKKETAF